MKKLTVFIAAIGLILPMMAQNVVKDDYESLQVRFTVNDVHIGQTVLDGETFSTLAIDGCLPSQGLGSPNLPVFSRLIEVPLCDGFKVTVTDAVYDTIGPLQHWVVPTQPSRSKSDTSAARLFINREVYSWNAFIGEKKADVEPVGIARDRNLARLQFSPVRYNPASGMLVVCRQATVTISYVNADTKATGELFNRYYSPAFKSGANTLNSLYPKAVSSSAPVRYIIVAGSMFRGQMDAFVQWKKRKGFLTDIVYTDDAAVGSTATSIQAYLQSQYTNATAANPAPTFVLLVGDVAQLPAFNGTEENSHVTDLYYSTWTTGDNIPDCHYGRFSAQNASQLLPQIQKTLMYEQYTFADPSFLDRAVMVAGVDYGYSGDHGYTHGDPAMDYGITNYFNGAHGFSNVYYFKNNTSVVPQGVSNVTVNSNGSSNVVTIRNLYNQGAGFINYTAHGSSAGWYNPGFETTQVSSMSNSQKFGIMIGNCCQTNMFGESACFGEALLRKDNYCGAVGYIGGSEVTYWDEDFYWAVGVRGSIGPSISMAYNANNLGVYDRCFHTHNEAYSDWATHQSSYIFFGNMAVQSSGSSLAKYYWEIYHLMGDPSVMNYLTQAPAMQLSAPATIAYGTTTLNVTAAPYAYVALTDTTTHDIIAAAWANASGQVTLNLGNNIPAGGYELAASAPQHQVGFTQLSVISPTGAFPTVSGISTSTPLIAGDTATFTITVENLGNASASAVSVSLASSSPMLTLLNNNITIANLAVGGQHIATVRAAVNAAAADNSTVNITATTSWNGCSNPATSIYPHTIVAPIPMLRYSNATPSVMPGNTTSLSLTLYNRGHADMHNWQISTSSPTQKLVAACSLTGGAVLAAGDSITGTLNITASNLTPQDINVPLYVTASHATALFTDTTDVYIGTNYVETFEGNQYNANGWTPGSLQWIITNTDAHEGTYSASSPNSMSHNTTAELSINRTTNRDDSIIFYYKVSSEANYDKFHFYIDGTEKISASGEVNWTRAAFHVSSGTHTFRFTYAKDNSVSKGSDRAWIDNVILPHTVQSTSFEHQDICDNDSTEHPDYVVNPNGSIVLYDFNILPTHNRTYTVANYNGEQYIWNGVAYTENGDYSQHFTNIYGCDSTVTLHLTFAGQVSIEGADDVTLRLFPNPTAGLLHFDTAVDEVMVYDVNGRLVATSNHTTTLDITALPTGVYTLRLTLPTGAATCRVIKK